MAKTKPVPNIPAFLRIPQAKRNTAWERNPPRAQVTQSTDENRSSEFRPDSSFHTDLGTQRLLAQQNVTREEKRAERIATLRALPKKQRKTPLAPDTHTITPALLAVDLKLAPRIIRQALRAVTKKPAHGWAFTPTEATTLKKDITSWLNKKPSSSTVPSKSAKKSVTQKSLSKPPAKKKPSKKQTLSRSKPKRK